MATIVCLFTSVLCQRTCLVSTVQCLVKPIAPSTHNTLMHIPGSVSADDLDIGEVAALEETEPRVSEP